MKTKKFKANLTKDEWYQAADYWSDNTRIMQKNDWLARCEAADHVENIMDHRDRWLIYSQYCLEKAGV